jgi:hypothetical protein
MVTLKSAVPYVWMTEVDVETLLGLSNSQKFDGYGYAEAAKFGRLP